MLNELMKTVSNKTKKELIDDFFRMYDLFSELEKELIVAQAQLKVHAQYQTIVTDYLRTK